VKRLALDLGARRIGVSLHDDDDVPARPAGTVEVTPDVPTLDALVALITREAPEEVIVGLPLNMDGTEGPAARGAQRVAAALRRRVSAKVVLWDERLTTTQAQRARIARGTKGRAGIDAEAATILLQSYVDARRGGSGWDPDAS
jgi:putative Holliday junction resolvase